ncbi:LysM repeat protein [Okibacterium sp. HSC-33S16]|uniref:lytic transglycosylase n=1 Tax=Okibacterium sp. HSC-33S16 TaxID=2910965 RepID=UPI00209F82EB|nr:LysM peptidoglycan-binding domain-containing protein [Okibacterium sp. HSC-33S16]MCP2032742.1 LysM repeat protein [Okibacterium sp. HSC-33S16]
MPLPPASYLLSPATSDSDRTSDSTDTAESALALRTAARAASRRRTRNLTLPLVLTGSIAASMQIALPATAHAAPSAPKPRSSVPAPTPPRAAPAPVVVQAAPAQYTVESGDTISGIASKFGLATASVLALNGLGWSSMIFPGQVLLLTGATASPDAPTPAPSAPAASTYTVVSGDTISGIASAHGVSVAAVFAANGLSSASIIYPGQNIAIPAAGATQAAPAPAPAPAPPLQAPQTPQTVTPLSAEMRANASVIVSTARSLGVGDYGIVIALAAAAQESSLRNVQHGDRDSMGLFQQRPSMGWGTADQVRDPIRATKAFFGGSSNPNPGLTSGLLDVPGWQSMSVTAAAQAVQKSDHPDAYAKWEASARAWLAELG